MGVKHFTELDVYKLAFSAAMEILEFGRGLPPEERHALAERADRPSRSAGTNLDEAWRK